MEHENVRYDIEDLENIIYKLINSCSLTKKERRIAQEINDMG